jgi:hypothetical protein
MQAKSPVGLLLGRIGQPHSGCVNAQTGPKKTREELLERQIKKAIEFDIELRYSRV